MSYRVLVVDDEQWVRQLVRGYLERAGFDVATATDGSDALRQLAHYRPDVVILDWMLPGLDGMEVVSRVRDTSAVPIIMLTARSEEDERVQGLEAGADDYVVKPFSPRELEARVRAVLRRSEGKLDRPSVVEVSGIQLDNAQRELLVLGKRVELTAMEFDLLAFLMEHPGQVFTRLELLEAIRGTTYDSFERSIDSHIKRLRQKIEPDPKNPRFVLTVFGVGYRFAKEGAS